MNDFVVAFRCGNCGDRWEREYPAKTRLHEITSDDVRATNKNCDEFGGGCDCCYRIQCPTCELWNEVSIVDRNPIEDDDEG